MKIRLLEAHGNFKPGDEWNCPWAAKARALIGEGKALALEAADRHLNPGGEGPAPVLPAADPGAKTAAKKTAAKKPAPKGKPKAVKKAPDPTPPTE